ncbi:MAG: CBASS cGAMP-activated phospholipase [Pseudomonadota bacterium]
MAIDGGGLKGAFPAAFLAEIEERSGQRIVDQFDLVAGTSTGGIIALGLAMGLSAGEILQFYRDRGPTIFGQRAGGAQGLGDWLGRAASNVGARARQFVRSKYSNRELAQALTDVFGERQLGESVTRLVIPAFDSTTCGPYVFKTAHHTRFKSDYTRRVVDVALATAAAPTFLPAHSFGGGTHIIDGGVWANNPAGAAALEAATILGWEMTEVRLLSVGCSRTYLPPKPDAGLIGAAKDKWILDLMMEGQACFSMAAAKLLLGHPHSNPHLVRIDPQVPRNFASLDDAAKIDALAGLGASVARQNQPEIERCFMVGRREPFVPEYHVTRRAA